MKGTSLVVRQIDCMVICDAHDNEAETIAKYKGHVLAFS